MVEAALTFPLTSGREAAGSAAALLQVEAAPPTPHTERVGLVSPLTEAPRSLTLQTMTTRSDRENSATPRASTTE